MALFGKKKPKLPSYVGAGLDALLQDPEWAHAISQAGIDIKECEIVLRLAGATVGVGMGVPQSASPAILLGQGNTLAIAYSGEREIQVVKHDKSKGELQTQRSGWFQILFGPAENLNGFMFWDHQDSLKLDSPEGKKFGPIMSAFLNGQLKPGHVVGTPQSLVSSDVSTEPPSPEFDDPEDALRWKLVHALQASLAEMIDKNSECFDKAESVEKAFAMANAEYVNGVRQHEISRNNFRDHAVRAEQELGVLLGELRQVTLAAQNQWKDLVFLLPGTENAVMRIANWCMSHGVESEVLSSVVGNGVFINTDFGLTRESFWAENERVAAVMKDAGQ